VSIEFDERVAAVEITAWQYSCAPNVVLRCVEVRCGVSAA